MSLSQKKRTTLGQMRNNCLLGLKLCISILVIVFFCRKKILSPSARRQSQNVVFVSTCSVFYSLQLVRRARTRTARSRATCRRARRAPTRTTSPREGAPPSARASADADTMTQAATAAKVMINSVVRLCRDVEPGEVSCCVKTKVNSENSLFMHTLMLLTRTREVDKK